MKYPSPKPKPSTPAPDAAHNWPVCPQLLHTQVERSQATLLDLSSDLSDREHTQNGPLSLGLAVAGNHQWVMTAIRTQIETEGCTYQPYEGWASF